MKRKIIILLSLICMFLGSGIASAATYIKAGNSDVGVVYLDADGVEVLRKDAGVFLMAATEERYTDATFLQELRKDEDLRGVIGASTLYLFDNRGQNYCVVANYLIDAQGKVCLDYGANMQMKPLTPADKILLNVYTLSLKVLEKKKLQQEKLNRWKNKF